MNRLIHHALTGALLAGAAAPVLAAPSALLRCDGYGRRVSVGENLARLPLVIGTLGIFGAPEADNVRARETGEKGIAACTEALADARTTGNPIRRAEVLLMRAARHVETAAYDKAWDDAAAAMALDVPAPLRPTFDRTLGYSALMTQALARLAQGRDAEAEALALQAAARRPWGQFMQNEAAQLLALSPAISAEEAVLLDRQFRHAPITYRASVREAADDWHGAAADYAAVIKARKEPDVVLLSRAAVVQALAGDPAGAEIALRDVQQKIDDLAIKAGGTDAAAQTAAQRVARADELVQLAKAQLALSAGRLEEARTLINGRGRWLAPAPLVARVAANAMARLPAGSITLDPAKLRADALRVQRENMTGKAIAPMLVAGFPRWESTDVQVAFGKDLATLDKSMKPKPGRDGTVTEMLNIKPGFVDTVTEAMLAAMAQAAKAKGADRFAIVDRLYLPSVTREGLSARYTNVQFVVPGDALWDTQKDRALTVAQVEAEVTPLFPAPPPVRR